MSGTERTVDVPTTLRHGDVMSFQFGAAGEPIDAVAVTRADGTLEQWARTGTHWSCHEVSAARVESNTLRERAIAAHIHWLEVCLRDAQTLARAVVDGSADRDDAADFLESTRKFRVGEGADMLERMA